MATQNIDTVAQGNNIAAAPAAQNQTPTTAPDARQAAANTIPQNSGGQDDSVRLSPEAVQKAALEQQTQQPSATPQAASQPATADAQEQQTATGETASGKTPPPPPVETPQEQMAAQDQQRIQTEHTIQNYTNASLYTQVNGKQIDENV